MKKVAIVGTGYRCYEMYAKPLSQNYDNVKIAAVCDLNQGRVEFYRNTLDKDIKAYSDYDKMLKEVKPDAVIVTTVDRFHHEYIIKALEAGIDVYTEKPITIDEEKCLLIREAEKKSGKKVTVTFNCRFMPYYAKIKELVKEGKIGRPLAVDYEYTLNNIHGGDYFKRWHRFLENCGGMMVHKATHHFDIVNWILEDDPVSVSAVGGRLFYGNDDRPHGERCCTCEYKDSCECYEDFYNDPLIKGLYFDNEKYDGYVRDHCVFKNDTNIYDYMSVSVKYAKGAILSYSLNLFAQQEGFTLNITGTTGRLCATFYPDESDFYKIVIKRADNASETYSFAKEGGKHAGGDERLLSMLFSEKKTDDPLGQCSTSYDGIKSAMIGIAANKSIKEGGRVDLTEFLKKVK